MKKYIKHLAIISFLAIAQIGAFTLKSHAQIPTAVNSAVVVVTQSDTWLKTWADTATYKSNAPELIADETTLIYQKNDAKIECDNEEIAQQLLRRYDQIIKRATWGYKKDRHGEYKHYLIIVSKSDAELIKTWAKTNL